MALINCPECSKEISDKAISCPNCGYPLTQNKTYNVVLKAVGQNKIKLIEKLRSLTGCSIKDAYDSTEHLTSNIIRKVDYPVALEYKTAIEKLGAEVDIVESDVAKSYNTFIFNPQISNLVKCPNCQSINTNKISTASKAGSALMWGVFAMGKISKTYECKNCGYRW